MRDVAVEKLPGILDILWSPPLNPQVAAIALRDGSGLRLGLVVADADNLRRPEVVAINVEITLHILIHLQHASARSMLSAVAQY